MAAQVQQVEGIRSELAAVNEQVSRLEQDVGVMASIDGNRWWSISRSWQQSWSR